MNAKANRLKTGPPRFKTLGVNVRLIVAIVTSLLDEAAILVVIIWVLPKLGLKLPWWGIILCIVGFALFAIATFQIGSRTLRMKPLAGLPDMVGTEGVTASRLDPDGFIKIESELWSARAEKGSIEKGCGVLVTAQNGLQLKVREKAGIFGSQGRRQDIPPLNQGRPGQVKKDRPG